MNFREHVLADVETWPAPLAAVFRELVSTKCYGEWTKYEPAEVELRAWVETRANEAAREPVVLNRHHLTPRAPQPTGKAWPDWAVYAGRAPSTAPKLGTGTAALAWRISHLLGNPWSAEDYPDALERYRLQLRRWMHADRAAAEALAADPKSPAKRVPEIDAIRDLSPRAALVCSCVSSPWTPEFTAPYPAPLPPSIKCHCHLIVAAWRALNKPARASTAAIVEPQGLRAPVGS